MAEVRGVAEVVFLNIVARSEGCGSSVARRSV